MKKLAFLLVEFYQKFISPLKPACCRFYPTCSEYAKTAFMRFGFFKGGILAVYRIIRCNPFNKGGIDYVPDNFFKGKK